jgi:hypothetical protein
MTKARTLPDGAVKDGRARKHEEVTLYARRNTIDL